MYTKLGYHTHFTYDPSSQDGDYGLPTTVQGDAFSQQDGTEAQPTQTFTYDADGNLSTYNKGNGVSTLTYDDLNRVTSVTDPDNVTSRTCYDAGGTVAAKQSSSQYALDGVVCGPNSDTFTYDGDGNELTQTRHYNAGTVGVTKKWYDGDDRLVETEQPANASMYKVPWLTRNIYDLTQGGYLTMDALTTQTFQAHGNMYKTEEDLPARIGTTANAAGSTSWLDTNGQAHDALDRQTIDYKYSPGDTSTVHLTTTTYDGAQGIGLVASSCNALNECTNEAQYDALNRAVDVTYSGDGGVTPEERSTFDPDGKIATAWNATLGTQSSTYDGDERLASVAEASGDGVTSPTTLTYGYYPNGWQMGLSVSSSGLSQQNLFVYSYRADGQRQTMNLDLPVGGYAGSYAFKWTYTDAGRELTRKDYGPGITSQAYTYDANGRVASYTLPGGSYSAYTYDTQDELTGYTLPNSTPNEPDIFGLAYTNNGEFLTQGVGAGADAGNAPANAISNGLSTATSNAAATHTVSWDARAGVVLTDNMVAATPRPSNCVPAKFQPCKSTYTSASTSNWTFDAAGRQVNGTGSTTTCQYSTQANPPPPTCLTVNKNPSPAPMRAYDAKNRLVGGGVSAITRTYGWGPNNHPQRIVDTNGNQETLHWDGDSLLFTTNASGQVDDLKIEDFGDVYPLYTPNSGVMLDDRDPGGVLITRHTLTGGTDYWSLQDPLLGSGYVKTLGFLPTGTFPDIVTGPQPAIAINELRTDGINDGYNTIQGVRAYEPGLNGWTTPDAYAGDISDPMSRKSYMWNGDNPIAYEDPSGYKWGTIDPSLRSALELTRFYGQVVKLQPSTRTVLA